MEAQEGVEVNVPFKNCALWWIFSIYFKSDVYIETGPLTLLEARGSGFRPSYVFLRAILKFCTQWHHFL